MKRIVYLLGLTLLFSFTSSILNPITEEERKAAIAFCKETQKAVADEIKGLSETQLNWKPADSVWSAAECVEHITLSEKNLFDWMMGTLKEPANPAKRSELKMDDETIKKMISSRGFKVKTREGFIPSGQFGNAAQTLAVFNERRAGLISWLEKTQDDMRNHFAQTPLGLVDSYQLVLFLSAHTRRHTLQIAELKTHPDFPKK